MAKNQEQEQRGPGRPAAFPGVKMVTSPVRVPEDVPALIRELAEARGMTRGQLVATLVRQAAKRRTRSKKAATAAE